MRITYPLHFALGLSPVGRAFLWKHEGEEKDYYYEVDTGEQVIRRSWFTIHEACDMTGEPLSAYIEEIRESLKLPLDQGWLPLMSSSGYEAQA